VDHGRRVEDLSETPCTDRHIRSRALSVRVPRVLRAFRRAGIDGDRARGALVHGLRHTFATELANSDVSVYTLMKLLGHESMVTAQRYVTAAGTETRAAAAQNRLYRASNRRSRNVKQQHSLIDGSELPSCWRRLLTKTRRAAKYRVAQCVPQHNRYYVK
jgi:hypothetical protein